MVEVKDGYVYLANKARVTGHEHEQVVREGHKVLKARARKLGLCVAPYFYVEQDACGRVDVAKTMSICRIGVPFLRYEGKAYLIGEDLQVHACSLDEVQCQTYIGPNLEPGRLIAMMKHIHPGTTAEDIAELLKRDAELLYGRNRSKAYSWEDLLSYETSHKGPRTYRIYKMNPGFSFEMLGKDRANMALAEVYNEAYQLASDVAERAEIQAILGRAPTIDVHQPEIIGDGLIIFKTYLDSEALAAFDSTVYAENPEETPELRLERLKADERIKIEAQREADEAGYYLEKLYVYRDTANSGLNKDKMLRVFGDNIVYKLDDAQDWWYFVDGRLVKGNAEQHTKIARRLGYKIAEEPLNLYLTEQVFDRLTPGMTKKEFLDTIKAVKTEDFKEIYKRREQAAKKYREQLELEYRFRYFLRLPNETSAPKELKLAVIAIHGPYVGYCSTSSRLPEYFRVYIDFKAVIPKEDKLELIRKYNRNLTYCCRQLVENSPAFKSAGIPLNFYQGEMTLRRDSRLAVEMSIKRIRCLEE